MDPLTLASKRFQTEVRLFWEPPPGRGAVTPRILRLDVDPTHQKDAVKSLRLLEWAPENRTPYVIFDARVDDGPTFLAALANKLESDHEKLRKGLAEDGLEVRPLAPIARPVTLRAVVDATRFVVSEVCRHLNGVALALVPARVGDGAAYAEIVRAFAPLSDGERLRLLVLSDPIIERELPGVARFEVDDAALLSHLKNLGGAQAAKTGPPDRRIQPTPEQRRRAEERTGKSVLPEQSARDLRALLLDAGQAMSSGQFRVAARKFRAARMLCHLVGQPLEEGAASVAVGSAALAGGDRVAALAAFRRGLELGEAQRSQSLMIQATFGIAGAHFFGGAYTKARDAYVELARLAGDLPTMRLEAMRMEAECLLHEGHPTEGSARLEDVLEETQKLSPDLREAVPYRAAGERLAGVLDDLGQPHRASATRSLVGSIATARDGGRGAAP